MMPRIYVDENDKTQEGYYMLDIAGSLKDIKKYEGQLHSGVRVLFNVQDEFEVEGVLQYDAENNTWLGQPDYRTRRDL